MRDKCKRVLSRLVLCLIVFIIAGTVGAVVCESNRVRVILPGASSEAQVRAAIGDLREILRGADRSQAEIDRMVHELRCKHLPETTEGCSDEESSEAEKER